MTQQAPKGKSVKPSQLYRGKDAPEEIATLPIDARSKEDFKSEMKRRREYRETEKLIERMEAEGV